MLNAQGDRELAYVVTIDEIRPIPNYDRVEHARVGGWWVIVKKDQFQVGEPAIYIEVDSKVPEKEPFMFLEKKHFKVKTQKMCGVVSQGLLMHPSDFGWLITTPMVGIFDRDNAIAYNIGDFLTKTLGITYASEEDNKRKAKINPNAKYNSMMSRHSKFAKTKFARWCMKRNWAKKILYFFLGNKKKDNAKTFPSHLEHIHRSDEERAENMPWILENKTRWIKTTKIDGTSSLFLLERKGRKREYWVCSRNVRQLDRDQKCYHDDNVYWEANDNNHIREFLEDILNKHPEWSYVAIQGEIAGCSSSGAAIQGDPHKFKELRFFGYNFITSNIGRWNSIDAANLCSSYGIEWVPIVDDNYILPDSFEEFKLSADGPCEANGASGNREGYVYRNFDNNTLSFKNVSREYLLKH